MNLRWPTRPCPFLRWLVRTDGRTWNQCRGVIGQYQFYSKIRDTSSVFKGNTHKKMCSDGLNRALSQKLHNTKSWLGPFHKKGKTSSFATTNCYSISVVKKIVVVGKINVGWGWRNWISQIILSMYVTCCRNYLIFLHICVYRYSR